jgi:hypothetical protein
LPRRPHKLAAARREFATLLDGHLRRGQHPDYEPSRWRPWGNLDLAGAVGVSPNSVANWRNTDNPIPPSDVLPLLDALFGDRPEFGGHRRALKEAWERARGLIPEEREIVDVWEPTSNQGSSLAEVILHQPLPTNHSPDSYLLHATLRLAPAEQCDGDRTVIVGLKAAFLSIAGSGYQTAWNSMIGERTPHPNVEPSVNGLIITGPTSSEGWLKGNPIGDDHLAIIEPGPPGNNSITISVCAGPRAFSFSYVSDPDKQPIKAEEKPNRAAVLNLLFGEDMPCDSQGRIILARSTIRRKTVA